MATAGDRHGPTQALRRFCGRRGAVRAGVARDLEER
jgi:hypothetical protein